MRGLSQGFQQGRPPFSQQPHRGADTEDASVSIARRRAATQRVQSRPRLIDRASTAQSAAPVWPAPTGGGLSHSDPGPGDGQGAAPLGSLSPLSAGQGDRVMQDRSSLDGPPSPKWRWASRGHPHHGEMGASDRPPTPAQPPRPTRGRHACRAGGQGSTGLAWGLPGPPLQGLSTARPGGVRLSLRPQRSWLPQGLLSSQPASPLLERRPDAAVFRILVFATSFGHELCQGPREYPCLPARAYPCLQHPKPRRTREASRARWKTA